jgi:hypothetical protein
MDDGEIDRIQAERRRRQRAARKLGWWDPPNDPTPLARRIYRLLYREPWPRGWIVRWVPALDDNVGGVCARNRLEILLSCATAHFRHGEVLRTLIHEFVHMRWPRMRHGRSFERLVEHGYRELVGIDYQPAPPVEGLDIEAYKRARYPGFLNDDEATDATA